MIIDYNLLPEEEVDVSLLHPLDRRLVVKVEEVGGEHHDQAHQMHLKEEMKNLSIANLKLLWANTISVSNLTPILF